MQLPTDLRSWSEIALDHLRSLSGDLLHILYSQNVMRKWPLLGIYCNLDIMHGWSRDWWSRQRSGQEARLWRIQLDEGSGSTQRSNIDTQGNRGNGRKCQGTMLKFTIGEWQHPLTLLISAYLRLYREISQSAILQTFVNSWSIWSYVSVMIRAKTDKNLWLVD